MGLDVLTAASSRALIELAAVKARLGITGTSQDADLQKLIDGASSSIDKYLGRCLARQTYHESIAGAGKPWILLSQFPVDRDSIAALINGQPVTTWRLHNREIGKLYLPGGWGATGACSTDGLNYAWGYGPGYSNVAYGDDATADITYTAGYLVPGQVTTWVAASSYAPGAWVRPTRPEASPLLFQCASAGSSGATEPAWPVPQVAFAGGRSSVSSQFSVGDGSATWTSRDAQELPSVLTKYAFLAIKLDYETNGRALGLTSMEGGGLRETYAQKSVDVELPDGVKRGLDIFAMGRS